MADSLPLSANFFHVFGFCVLFLSLCSCKSCVYGARELASHQHANQKMSLLTASPCSASTKGLQVADKDGPCSPLGHENPSPISGEILLQDQFRVRSLSYISAQGTELTLQEITNTDNFGVQVGFGTPTVALTLLFDTGSSETWIRCGPCTSKPICTESIFNPSMSKTFNYPMVDDCTSPSPPCNFVVTYRDSTSSQGYYAHDTVTFSSTDVFSVFVFGCGRSISENFGADGVLGMEPGEHSLMSQTLNSFQKRFCYCLPSTKGSSGYLIFGDQARQTCNNPETIIPLYTHDNHYLVNFVGITIGGKRLERANLNSLPSTIFDSGTPIGRLPQLVYEELSSFFKVRISQLYPNASQASREGIMDTCYNLGDITNIPSMILHFDDSKSNDLNLDTSAVVMRIGDSDKVCLAFAASRDNMAIIGNYQLRDFNINYDVLGQQVGFRRGGCGA